jgi:ABC-type bacteriocin/lantibiotic exporter with double-glycine peptidase domain
MDPSMRGSDAMDSPQRLLSKWTDFIRRYEGGDSFGHSIGSGANKLVVIGKSGSGKTRLLELLLGARDGGASADMQSRAPSYVIYLTDVAQFEDGTIGENGLSQSQETLDLLKLVDLAHDDAAAVEFLNRRIDKSGDPLSLGERQRIQLVRALASRPKVLLMDEALSGVAEAAELKILKSLFSGPLRDVAVIYVSHRPVIQSLFEHRVVLG